MNNLLVWLLQQILERHYWYDNIYLRSNHWQKMKREYKMNYCEKCGAEHGLELHHKTYYDRKGRSILWRERDRHFETLCRECHGTIHRKG